MKIVWFSRLFGRGDGIWTHDLMVPNHTRYQLRYASIFSIFRYFRKWSNMWSSHLFRTFCRKVYRPNCQRCQGVQRFEKIYQGKPLWVSRTIRATSCATPRFFKLLSMVKTLSFPQKNLFFWKICVASRGEKNKKRQTWCLSFFVSFSDCDRISWKDPYTLYRIS